MTTQKEVALLLTTTCTSMSSTIYHDRSSPVKYTRNHGAPGTYQVQYQNIFHWTDMTVRGYIYEDQTILTLRSPW